MRQQMCPEAAGYRLRLFLACLVKNESETPSDPRTSKCSLFFGSLFSILLRGLKECNSHFVVEFGSSFLLYFHR